MTEQTPEPDSKANDAKPSQAPAAPAADPAPVETVRLVLLPDAFTVAHVAFAASTGEQVRITAEGADVPAADAEDIIKQAVSMDIRLIEQEA